MGAVAALAGIGTQFPQFKPYADLIGFLAVGMLGVVAKDKNVTGGTISAATGIETVKAVSLVDTQPAIMRKS